MKIDKDNFAEYSILLILLSFLISFIIQFYFSLPNDLKSITEQFGPLPYLLLILMIAAIISIFIRYKFNWIVISLPFLWYLLLPMKVNVEFYMGSLVNIIAFAFKGISGSTLYIRYLLESLLPLCIICYFMIKNIRKIKDIKYEIAFTILILFFSFILPFFH